jgi:hypothetical protein
MYFGIKNTLKNNRYHNPKHIPHPDLTAQKEKQIIIKKLLAERI